MENDKSKDKGDALNIDAFTYAISKLRAAAVLSAFYRHDMYNTHNLGFIGTTYTIAHEGMELLLKVYLRRVLKLDGKKTWGHDLGKLFMKWDAKSRTKAEIAYQEGVLNDLESNRICQAALKATMNLGSYQEPPSDYSEREAEYQEAFRRYQVELLQEGSPTVGDVVRKLDVALGQKNITSLCSGYANEIQGYSWGPEVWYPEELLGMKWSRFVNASRKGESLGLVETFLKREGSKNVFEGWRYQEEMKLDELGIVFHGPPAKMILIAQHLEDIVFESLPNA